MPYRFEEDVAIADVEFRAWGETLEETFRAAADATMNVMVSDLESIEYREERRIALENEQLDMLLFEFLGELVYHKDVDQLLLRVPQVAIDALDGVYRLESVARGERLDPERHEQGADVKAVTLHRFRLERTDGGWSAYVILDI